MKVLASLAAAAALLSLGSPALAQAPLPVPIWTGAYLGALGGAIGGDFDTSLSLGEGEDSFPVDRSSFDDTSWLAGVQAGYDVQRGSFVFGAVADWMGTDLSGSSSFDNFICFGEDACDDFFGDVAASLDWLATFRGKLGYASGPFLFYVTGGLAVGKVEGEFGLFGGDGGGNGGGGGGGGGAALSVHSDANVLDSGNYEYFDRASSTEVGFAIGAGAAMQFTPHLVGEITYLHVDLGTADYDLDFFNGETGGPGNGSVDFSADLGRFALSYKF